VQVIIETIEGFVLQRKEEGSSELCRSFVLCTEGFLVTVCCNQLKTLIKNKSWCMYPQGGGEPRTCCVALLCAMYRCVSM
jgi:hypothetical protein